MRSSCPKAIPARPGARPRRRCRPGPRAGIKRIDGKPLGEGDAGLLLPAGPQGPAFLVTHNFDVIYSYNAAESYTLAIAILAQRLAGGPGIVTPWPTDDPGLSRAERRELQTLLAKHGYDVGAPRRRDRRQDQARDRRFPGQERADGRRAGVGEGAGGVEEVRVRFADPLQSAE